MAKRPRGPRRPTGRGQITPKTGAKRPRPPAPKVKTPPPATAAEERSFCAAVMPFLRWLYRWIVIHLPALGVSSKAYAATAWDAVERHFRGH